MVMSSFGNIVVKVTDALGSLCLIKEVEVRMYKGSLCLYKYVFIYTFLISHPEELI